MVIVMTAGKAFHGRTDASKDLIGGSQAVDALQLFLPSVIVEQWRRLAFKALDPPGKDLRVVVLPLTVEHSPHELLTGNCQLDDPVEAHCLTLKKLIEGGRLTNRPRKTIEQAPVTTVRPHQSLTDHAHDQLIGDELAVLHETGGLLALASAVEHRLPKHFTGGEMRNVQVFHEPLALRAFAGSRWPNKDDPHVSRAAAGLETRQHNEVVKKTDGDQALRTGPPTFTGASAAAQDFSKRPL